MVGYGRFRKSSKVNGSYRGKYRSNTTSGYGSYSKGKKTTYRRYYLENKEVEKKYADQSMVCTTWIPEVVSYEAIPGASGSMTVQGVKFMSQIRRSIGSDTGNNMLSFVGGGSTAVTRIGNKIDAKWLDLGVTLEAAKSPLDHGGEQVNVEGAVVKGTYYMKTVYRLVLVKDMQANNPTNVVLWNDVFGGGGQGLDGTYFGAADKLDIPNMGRFRIIKDIKVTLDADDPLKNVKMGCSPGAIRYNSASSGSLTDKGFYLVIAQDVIGTASSIGSVIPGIVRCGVRLTFTDN